MRIIKRTLLIFLALIAATILYVYLSLRPNIPTEQLNVSAAMIEPNTDAPILIFGATRNTGLELAKNLYQRGEPIFAFVRASSNVDALNELGAELLVGDAMDPASIENAFATQSFRAVVSTVGCFSCDPPVDFVGNKNIIDAAKAANVPKVMLVSTIGAGDSFDSVPFITKVALKRILPLKTSAEQHLVNSELDYTIIRPGGLGHDAATGTGMLSEDRSTFGYIDRAELADLMLSCLDSTICSNKTLAAVDKNRAAPW